MGFWWMSDGDDVNTAYAALTALTMLWGMLCKIAPSARETLSSQYVHCICMYLAQVRASAGLSVLLITKLKDTVRQQCPKES